MESDHSVHFFEETRERSTCDFCGDEWPTAELVVKYFSCNACGISVHKGCMQLAKEWESCVGSREALS